MSVTLSGPVLLLILLWVFFRRPDQLAATVVFFAPFSATAIINISAITYGVSPGIVALLLFFAATLLLGRGLHDVRISRNHLGSLFLLLMFATVVVAEVVALPMRGVTMTMRHIFQTMFIVASVLATVLLSLDFTRPGGLERGLAAARISAAFVAVWGIVQAACFYGHVPYPDFLFNNSTSDSADMYAQGSDTVTRIASVAVEPSVLAASLLHFGAFGATVLLLDPRMRIRAWLWPVGLTLLVLVASTSTTAYIGLVTLFLLLGLRRPAILVVGGIAGSIVVSLMLILLPGLRLALWEMTVGKTGSFSYMERMAAVQNALSYFKANPWLGGGWGTASPSDLFVTLLSNSGVIGGVLYIAALTAAILTSQRARAGLRPERHGVLVAYASGAENALIVAHVCAMTSGLKYVFLDDWVYWALLLAIASRLTLARLPRMAPAQASGYQPVTRVLHQAK